MPRFSVRIAHARICRAQRTVNVPTLVGCPWNCHGHRMKKSVPWTCILKGICLPCKPLHSEIGNEDSQRKGFHAISPDALLIV